MSLRPGLLVQVERSSLTGDISHLFLIRNVTPNPAVDVSIEIETAQRRLIACDQGIRIPGHLPENLEGDPWVKLLFHRRSWKSWESEVTFIITIRFSDQYFLQRWEQEVTTMYEVGTFINIPFGSWSTPRGSEIRPYRRRRARVVFPWMQRRAAL